MILGQDWSLAKETLQNYCLKTHYTDLVWFDFIVSTDLWVPDSFFVDTTIWRGPAAHPKNPWSNIAFLHNLVYLHNDVNGFSKYESGGKVYAGTIDKAPGFESIFSVTGRSRSDVSHSVTESLRIQIET